MWQMHLDTWFFQCQSDSSYVYVSVCDTRLHRSILFDHHHKIFVPPMVFG